MRTIIFDMDGTLIDSGNSITNTVNFVREKLGFEKMQKDYILEKVNDPNVNSSKFFYGTDNFTKQQQKLFEEHYNANCLKDLELYEGVKKLIDDLSDEFILTVATNANSNFAKKMLSHLEIEKYFKTIVGYDSVNKPKPHPEMINKILENYNIKQKDAQLIGDSHKDVMAAKNAGVDWVLVNWGFSNYEDGAIENIQELEKEIYKKFK